MRHEARLNRPIKTGGTVRDNLALAAPHSEVVRAALEGPECPESLEYLLGWAYELHGRTGLGMDGVAPLGYSTLADWARLRGVALEWWEVETLLRVDAELRHPGEDEPAKEED